VLRALRSGSSPGFIATILEIIALIRVGGWDGGDRRMAPGAE
jgi:hypothetical protein